MTSDLRRAGVTTIRNEAFRFEFAEHNCFACGTLNSHGLGLELHLERGRAWTEIVLDRRFEGWERVAHGGIVATILDEVMAWSLVASDNWGVTARLAVAFRQPVRVETQIRADGWISTARRRLVDTAARIVDVAADVELATATGVYAAASEARKRELQARYGFRRLEPVMDAVR